MTTWEESETEKRMRHGQIRKFCLQHQKLDFLLHIASSQNQDVHQVLQVSNNLSLFAQCCIYLTRVFTFRCAQVVKSHRPEIDVTLISEHPARRKVIHVAL